MARAALARRNLMTCACGTLRPQLQHAAVRPLPLYVDTDGDCAHEFWEKKEAGENAALTGSDLLRVKTRSCGQGGRKRKNPRAEVVKGPEVKMFTDAWVLGDPALEPCWLGLAWEMADSDLSRLN
eukprot:s20_g16.t1